MHEAIDFATNNLKNQPVLFHFRYSIQQYYALYNIQYTVQSIHYTVCSRQSLP